MKKPVIVVLAALLAGGLTGLYAQPAPTRVGFVNTRETLRAHPQGKALLDLAAARDKELKEITDKAAPLGQKVGTGAATAAERESYNALLKTYQATAKRYQDQYAKAEGPVTKDIDAAVKTAARAQGFALVLSAEAGQATGIVIYGDENADLTDEVVKAIKR